MKAIYWLRDDLRLHDNQALHEFCTHADQGLMVWSASPSILRANGFRKLFVFQSLANLIQRVRGMGGDVVVSLESASQLLPRLVKNENVDRIYCSAQQTTEEIHEEDELYRKLGDRFVRVGPQNTLLHLDDLPFGLEALPPVFTSFRKAVEADLKIRPEVPEPMVLPASFVVGSDVTTIDLFTEIEALSIAGFRNDRVVAGEAEALDRLKFYLFESDGIQTYKETRNGLMRWDDSSKLSHFLSVGSISPRRIFFELKRYERERLSNESTYWLFFELLWRDYFKFIARKLGSRIFGGRLSVNAEERDFERWCIGETDDPFVNANMRELNQTGLMSNRGRQNVASYLAKTLRVDWRLGAQYFERQLIDYDAASNWGNWSYLAGVGQDPRNRVFNPERQAALYDPDGVYQKKWLSQS